MEWFYTTKWKVFAGLDPQTRERIAQKTVAGATAKELLSMLDRNNCPAELVEAAATHPKFTIRRAAAADSKLSRRTLQMLLADSNSSVADTARVSLLLKDAKTRAGDPDDSDEPGELDEAGDPDSRKLPDYTPALASLLGAAIRGNQFSLYRIERLLKALYADEAWVADKALMKTAWKSHIYLFDVLAESLGPSVALRETLALGTAREKWAAVDMVLQCADEPSEVFRAIEGNMDAVAGMVSALNLFRGAEVSPDKRISRLERRDEAVQCAYLSLPECPEDDLRIAAQFTSGLTDMAGHVAILNGSKRESFRAWALDEVNRRLDEEGYLMWPLMNALSTSELLDVPLRGLSQASDDDYGIAEKALDEFTRELRAILEQRPEAWDIYATLDEDFEGTAREMLAAVRDL